MDRYFRQAILPEIGEYGLSLIRKGKILCVGAGGLGSPALLYLAAAGVGTIGIVDGDYVDESNLQRQVIYDTHKIASSKVEAAAERLRNFNPDIVIHKFNYFLTVDNVLKIFSAYDAIIDGTDNFSTKYLINDAAVKLRKPVIYGALSGFEGQISVFDAKQGPCYRCLYPTEPINPQQNCAQTGIIGAVAGLIGTTQALEAIKLLLGQDHCQETKLQPLIGRLWIIDARSMETSILKIPKNIFCPLCTKESSDITLSAKSILCQITTENLSEFKKARFIDVREPSEWLSGIIPEAICLPLSKIQENQKVIKQLDPFQSYIIYCQSGMRSQIAAQILIQEGFQKVSNFKGGISHWTGSLSFLTSTSNLILNVSQE